MGGARSCLTGQARRPPTGFDPSGPHCRVRAAPPLSPDWSQTALCAVLSPSPSLRRSGGRTTLPRSDSYFTGG